jgi:hypothetical protein
MYVERLGVCEVILNRRWNQGGLKAFRDFPQKVFRSVSYIGEVRAELACGMRQFKLGARVRVLHADRSPEFCTEDSRLLLPIIDPKTKHRFLASSKSRSLETLCYDSLSLVSRIPSPR